jgi:hypothetical protein
MDDNYRVSGRHKKLSKGMLRVIALASFTVAVYCLLLCIKVGEGTLLKPGTTLNPEVARNLIDMVREANFYIIPGLSVLLIMSSLLIWIISKKVDDK